MVQDTYNGRLIGKRMIYRMVSFSMTS